MFEKDEIVLKKSILITFVLGLITHAYAFLNLTISHDSLCQFYIADNSHKISIGRIWFPGYISLTHGKIVVPWMIGLIGLLWISFAVYFIVKICGKKENGFIFFTSAICVINPTVISIISTYIHDFDADMFALLLSVLAAFLWLKAVSNRELKWKILTLCVASILQSISCGLYQSYISVTITLIIIVSIKNLLNGIKYK